MSILVSDRLSAGGRRASWNTVGVRSGLYSCRIPTAQGAVTRSVLVLLYFEVTCASGADQIAAPARSWEADPDAQLRGGNARTACS